MYNSPSFSGFNFLALRTTLFPLYNLQKQITCFPAGKSGATEFFLQQINNDAFAEALLVSSEELYRKYKSIMEAGLQPGDQKAFRKIIQYYIRMCCRSTPFGLCAGLGLLEQGGHTGIELADTEQHRKSTHADFAFYNLVIAKWLNDPARWAELSFFANNTIRIRDGYFVFLKIAQLPYVQSSIKSSPLIDGILSFTRQTRTHAEIMQFLGSEYGSAGDKEFESLIEKLVKVELLIPDIWPDIFADDPDDSFFSRLPADPALNRLRELMHRYAALPAGHGIDALGTVKQEMEQITGIPDFKALHIDLDLKLDQHHLNKNVTDALCTGIDFLLRLFPQQPSVFMTDFIHAYKEIYGEKEMPLLDVLDERKGIGFPVLRGPMPASSVLNYGRMLARSPARDFPVNEWDGFLLQKLAEWRFRGSAHNLELFDEDLSICTSGLDEQHLEGFSNALFSLLAASEAAIDDGRFTVDFHSCSTGRSGIKYLGRFANLNQEIKGALQQNARAEMDWYRERGIVLAEVKFLPRLTSTGNVIVRNNLYDHEIPVLQPMDSAGVLPLNELLITVRGNRVYLRHKDRPELILPRAVTAYDHFEEASCHINIFLSEMQMQQEVNNIIWSWGRVAGMLDFLPRVVYKQCIFSKAAWQIKPSHFEKQELAQPDAWKKAFGRLVKQRNIPRIVYLQGHSDQALLMDLENELSLELLFAEMRDRGRLVLTENLFDAENTFIRSGLGYHVNEFAVPLQLKKRATGLATEELYQKLSVWYHGPAVEELVLALNRQFGEAEQPLFWERVVDRLSCIHFYFEGVAGDAAWRKTVEAAIGAMPQGNLIWKLEWAQAGKTITSGNPVFDRVEMKLAGNILRHLEANQRLMDYDGRLAALALAAIHYANWIFGGENEQAKVDAALARLALHPDVGITEESAHAIFKKLLELMIKDEKGIYQPMTGLFKQYREELNAIPPLAEAAYLPLIGSLANRLMYQKVRENEWLVVLKFAKQFIWQEASLVKFRKVMWR